MKDPYASEFKLPPDLVERGEELRLALRPTARALFPSLVMMGVLFLTVIVGSIGAIAGAAIGLLLAYVYLTEVRARHFYITTDRIIIFRRYISTHEDSVSYNDLTDIVLSRKHKGWTSTRKQTLYLSTPISKVTTAVVDQSLFGRLLGYGSVTLHLYYSVMTGIVGGEQSRLGGLFGYQNTVEQLTPETHKSHRRNIRYLYRIGGVKDPWHVWAEIQRVIHFHQYPTLYGMR